MEEFFNIEPREPYKMTQSDFIEKTQKLLLNIESAYSRAWKSRALKDEEFPDELVCDKCTGCGTFKENGEERDCVQDSEMGWCYRFADCRCWRIRKINFQP